MGKVVFNMSMSLDGFVAGSNDEVDQLFGWYFSGDTEFPFPGSEYVFRVSPASAELLQEAISTIGAMVTGRRNFNLAGGWGGKPPLGVHHFVVTHHPPQAWVKEGSPFTFVTDGVERAITQARQAAGEKDVCISSANILQQCLRAGLVDELHLDVVPVLLGKGIRLFELTGSESIALAITRVVEGTGVTHLRYTVTK